MNCGLVFRGYIGWYMHKGILTEKKELRLLKSKSCKCDKCLAWLDEIENMICLEAVIFPNIENKKLYTPVVTNVVKDWETGYVDSYNVEFKQVKE